MNSSAPGAGQGKARGQGATGGRSPANAGQSLIQVPPAFNIEIFDGPRKLDPSISPPPVGAECSPSPHLRGALPAELEVKAASLITSTEGIGTDGAGARHATIPLITNESSK